MANNPLLRPSVSPTKTTQPTKAVNNVDTSIRLTHNTFDNSYFNFKTQRYGQYEPFWWKPAVAGDVEPFSNSHNVRSLPFSSPILSSMKLNKDYFQVPMTAIQPQTWEYIFKDPVQGDDVPFDVQNVLPLYYVSEGESLYLPSSICDSLMGTFNYISRLASGDDVNPTSILSFLIAELWFSSGCLLYNLGYKFNPLFAYDVDGQGSSRFESFDSLFDRLFSGLDLSFTVSLPSGDSTTDFHVTTISNVDNPGVDLFTAISLLRSYSAYVVWSEFEATRNSSSIGFIEEFYLGEMVVPDSTDFNPAVLRMDVPLAYQLSCAQYYVNPRVDFIYNSQLYRDNFINLLRLAGQTINSTVTIQSFDYNGIPVFYDYFSLYYYSFLTRYLYRSFTNTSLSLSYRVYDVMSYLFGYREQLLFGNYFTDSRTQALGYGEAGSDYVAINDDGVSVTDLTQKLVLQRFRGAVAHLDNSHEDYLATMFHENLPPDFHYPKFIAHSEFGINGEEISNTTSDNQGNIVTNLKSGEDSAEFNIDISMPSILIGISHISMPEVYSQIKERQYFHIDRFDMFQPMLQYFGDQAIYGIEVSDSLPSDSIYAYTSRNGEYKQRISQCSGGFLGPLRSWIFNIDSPRFNEDTSSIISFTSQSPFAIRAHDFYFNRFLARQSGLSLGNGFHFIIVYNNKNVDTRPMDVNPIPLYPKSNI